MVFSCYPHAFLARQIFEQNFRYILCLWMAKLSFGDPSNRGCRVHQDINGHHMSEISTCRCHALRHVATAWLADNGRWHLSRVVTF